MESQREDVDMTSAQTTAASAGETNGGDGGLGESLACGCSTVVAPPPGGASTRASISAPEVGGAAVDTAVRVSAPELPGAHQREFSLRQPPPAPSAQPPGAPPRRRGRAGRPRKVAAQAVQQDTEQLPRAKGLTGPMPQPPNILGMSVVLNLAPCRPSAPHAQPVEDSFMKDNLIMIITPPKATRLPTPARVDAAASAALPPPRRKQKAEADMSPSQSPPVHLLKMSPAASPKLTVTHVGGESATPPGPSTMGDDDAAAATAISAVATPVDDSPFPSTSALEPAPFPMADTGLARHLGDGEYILRTFSPTQHLPMGDGELDCDAMLDMNLQMRMDMDAADDAIGHDSSARCPPGAGASSKSVGATGLPNEVWGAELLAIWPDDHRPDASAAGNSASALDSEADPYLPTLQVGDKRRPRLDFFEQTEEIVLPPLPESLDQAPEAAYPYERATNASRSPIGMYQAASESAAYPYERPTNANRSPVDMYKSLAGLHSALPMRSPPADL